MAKLPYMPFYPADWLLDTQDLSPEAYQAYHRLLCNMWLTRKMCLPNDPAVLRTRAGFSPQKWRYIWSEIEGFFQIENGQVSHQRLTKEGVKAEARHMARSEAGRAGAKSKWLKDKGTPHGKANGKTNDKRDANHNHTVYKDSARARKDDQNDFSKGDPDPKQTHQISAIKSGKKFLCAQITAAAARTLIDQGSVTADECKKVGIL